MRFAGTWKQYSKKAIPQLARMTFQSASLRNFKWPYHAKVMKILDTMSNRIVRIRKGAPCTVPRYRLETRKDSPKLLFPQRLSAGLNATALPSHFPFLTPGKSWKKPPTLSNCFVRSAPDSRDPGGPKASKVNGVIHDPVVDQPISGVETTMPPEAPAFRANGIHVRKASQ